MRSIVSIVGGILIRLQKFIESDIDKLITEVPDASFLLQWAGPKYNYPLDIAQLSGTLAKTTGLNPSYKIFKAIHVNTSETLVHIQLMDIDYRSSNCVLGRVLIFQDHRGNGFGKAIVESAIKEAFENTGMYEITLGVFDFNASAIATYKSIGFVEYESKEGARQFQTEKWNIIKMKFHKDKWLQKEKY
jgi:RimJ/RimL family protein N-acetyltransferase